MGKRTTFHIAPDRIEIGDASHTPPRPSTAPYAEFERQTVDALQGIRAELDRLADTDHRLAQGLLALAQELRPSSRWERFVAWFRLHAYDPTPRKDDGTLKFDANPGDGY